MTFAKDIWPQTASFQPIQKGAATNKKQARTRHKPELNRKGQNRDFFITLDAKIMGSNGQNSEQCFRPQI